jgi:hypothetical protein
MVYTHDKIQTGHQRNKCEDGEGERPRRELGAQCSARLACLKRMKLQLNCRAAKIQKYAGNAFARLARTRA